MKVKCPCLNCNYHVFVEEGIFRHSKSKAYEILKLHVLGKHTVEEIKEWLERALVEYFEKKLEEG